MKKCVCILATLLISLVSSLFFQSCSVISSDNNKFSIQNVINGIGVIQKYQVNLNAKIYPPTASDLDPNISDDFDPNRFMEVKSRVFGESGKKMKIQTIMKSPEFGAEMEYTLIFDGTWLWVQQKVNKYPQMKTNKPMISAMKIHIPSVSPDPVNEPFNTIYGITGIGLFRCKDLPGTFMELIEDYSFIYKIHSKDTNEIIFSGTKKIDQQNTEGKEVHKKLIEYMDKSTKFCKLWVAENTGLIKEYSIGKSEKRPTMNTIIEYISVNEQLPDGTFSYVPPEGVIVRDATATILKQKANNQ